ncbi:integrase core domain-containing protein [Microvirga sp.]|uniref:integrase core domain-containing protein n=1 Tax=Microvirga sp. TaxID=1873136 RepID=UPI00391B6812
MLSDLFILRQHILSCFGAHFIAKAITKSITAAGAKTAYLVPSKPWNNRFIESFDARRRDELLDREIFHSLIAAKHARPQAQR